MMVAQSRKSLESFWLLSAIVRSLKISDALIARALCYFAGTFVMTPEARMDTIRVLENTTKAFGFEPNQTIATQLVGVTRPACAIWLKDFPRAVRHLSMSRTVRLLNLRVKGLSFSFPSHIEAGVQLRSASAVRFEEYVKVKEHVVIDGRSSLDQSIRIGHSSYIKSYALLDACGGYIKIGSSSSVGNACRLLGMGGIDIGSYVIIGPGSTIVSGNHTHDLISPLPFALQGSSHKGITIEDNVWLGANVVVLDGVVIGRNSVVGAGTILDRSVPPGSVVTGQRSYMHLEHEGQHE